MTRKTTTKDVATNENFTGNVPAVAKDATPQFLIMTVPKGEISLILEENLGNSGISVNNLPRIKVPGSGGTTWTRPSVDGPRDTRELVGVIIFTKNVRTYWEESFDESGGGSPPDCYSPDAEYGIGVWADKVPDRKCGNCPMAKFKEDGTGQPCKESRLIFMVLEDELLPIVIKAPVMSLDNARTYLLGLSSRMQRIHAVYTRLTLEADKNARGIPYAKIIFEKAGDVEDPSVTADYAASIRPHLESAADTMAKTRSADNGDSGDDTTGATAYAGDPVDPDGNADA
jgi:hypothetical protein